MKMPECLELISGVNQLDHHQRTLLATALTQLSNEPRVSKLIETSFDTKGICLYYSNAESYKHGPASGLQPYRDTKHIRTYLMHFHRVATKYLPNHLGWCRVMGDFQHLMMA